MTIKNRIIGVIASIIVAMLIATILILFWKPLTTMTEGINVGIFMFLNQGFWALMFFIGGLILVIGIITRFALKAKWGSVNN